MAKDVSLEKRMTPRNSRCETEAPWANRGSRSSQMGPVEGSEKRSFSLLGVAWRTKR